MSKVSIEVKKNVLFEGFVTVFLFCSVSHCYKEFAQHNEDQAHRVPLCRGACWDVKVGLLFCYYR